MKYLFLVITLVFSIHSFAATAEVTSTDQTVNIQRAITTNDQIKSCLAGIYLNQMHFHKSNGAFTRSPEEFGLNTNSSCKGLHVSADIANKKEFKVVAKAGDTMWSVDQTKTITKLK